MANFKITMYGLLLTRWLAVGKATYDFKLKGAPRHGYLHVILDWP